MVLFQSKIHMCAVSFAVDEEKSQLKWTVVVPAVLLPVLFQISSFLISALLSLLLASLCLVHSIFFTFFTNSYKYKEALGKILTLGCNFSLYFYWLGSWHYIPFYLSLYCLFLLWEIRDPGLPACLVLDFVFQPPTALYDTCSFNRLLLLFMVRLSLPFFLQDFSSCMFSILSLCIV